MTENGVDNPAFEPPSPEEQRAAPGLRRPSPGVEPPREELCGWGRCAPRVLQLCNNAEGYLLFYSLLSVFQGPLGRGASGTAVALEGRPEDADCEAVGQARGRRCIPGAGKHALHARKSRTHLPHEDKCRPGLPPPKPAPPHAAC
ncbi:UNVERIFIED_CONTAM: hypothetical protein K2H54_057464 [Gekko kuhli]